MRANFNEFARFKRELNKKWPPLDYQFPLLLFDFVYQQEGYQKDHYGAPLFKEVIPKLLVKEYGLKVAWFPNSIEIQDLIEESFDELCSAGCWFELVRDKDENPLFKITRMSEYLWGANKNESKSSGNEAKRLDKDFPWVRLVFETP